MLYWGLKWDCKVTGEITVAAPVGKWPSTVRHFSQQGANSLQTKKKNSFLEIWVFIEEAGDVTLMSASNKARWNWASPPWAGVERWSRKPSEEHPGAIMAPASQREGNMLSNSPQILRLGGSNEVIFPTVTTHPHIRRGTVSALALGHKECRCCSVAVSWQTYQRIREGILAPAASTDIIWTFG